jgi:hypothetical protein
MDKNIENSYLNSEREVPSVYDLYQIFRNFEILVLRKKRGRQFSLNEAKEVLEKEEGVAKKPKRGAYLNFAGSPSLESFDFSRKILETSVNLANRYGDRIKNIPLYGLFLDKFRNLLFKYYKDGGPDLGIDPLANIIANFQGKAFEVRVVPNNRIPQLEQEKVLSEVAERGRRGWEDFTKILWEMKDDLERGAQNKVAS